MPTSFDASAEHIATTRQGGTILYRGADISLIDAVAGFIVFLVALMWGAVVTSWPVPRRRSRILYAPTSAWRRPAFLAPGKVMRPGRANVWLRSRRHWRIAGIWIRQYAAGVMALVWRWNRE